MSNQKKLVVFALIVIFGSCMVSIDCAYAGTGTRFLGFSARDSAMAGATTASSEDTSCLVRNPAGLVRIGNRVDVEYENVFLHDVTLHTEGALTNAGLYQESSINYLPAGNAAVSYRIAGTEKYPISVGFGVFSMSGLALNYASSRTVTAYSGDYDKMVDLRSMRLAPGLAVAFNDKFSFGATANIGIQALRTNMATSNFVGGHYLQTAGQGDWDFAPGGGFTLGLLYKFHEMLDLGVSYESHGWFGDHYKYKDSLWYIDEPPIINFGLSFKPVKKLVVTYDTRYVNWTDVKIARMKPNEGGFGWQDQWVFATGIEYTVCDKLKLRLGYNYGKSPIQNESIYACSLLPVIMEHHLTTGFSYVITKNLSLDMAWEHHFKNVMAENGAGDAYSVNGNGTKVSASADVLGIGLGYKF